MRWRKRGGGGRFGGGSEGEDGRKEGGEGEGDGKEEVEEVQVKKEKEVEVQAETKMGIDVEEKKAGGCGGKGGEVDGFGRASVGEDKIGGKKEGKK